MTTLFLPPDDWGILADTELGSVLPLLHPASNKVQVLAVFDDDGCLSGCWAALQMTHVEGVWVSNEHRCRTGVQRALLRAMRGILKEWGVTEAITGAADSAVKSLLSKKGRAVKMPDTYLMKFGV